MQFTHFLALIKVFLYLDLYSLSHTVFAVSLILLLHNILFGCNSTIFSLLSHRRFCVNNGMVSITHLKVSHGDLISFQENDARIRGEEIGRFAFIITWTYYYFAMLKKLQDSLIPYSTNVESIVKHSILSFKNQTDCQNSYAQSLLYSTKAETEPKTMISIFLLSH